MRSPLPEGDVDDLGSEPVDALNAEMAPAAAAPGTDVGAPAEDEEPPPFWDTYDAINQLYLELGTSHFHRTL